MTKNRILSKVWFLELGISTDKMFFDLSKRIDSNSSLELERSLFKTELNLNFKFFRSYSKKDIFYVPDSLKSFSSADWVKEEDIAEIIDLYMKKTYSKSVMYGNDFSYSKTGIVIQTRVIAQIDISNTSNLKIEDINDAFMLKAPLIPAGLIYEVPGENNVYIMNLLSDTAVLQFRFIENKKMKNVYLRKMQNAKNLYEQVCIICNYLNAGIIKIAI